MHDMHFKITWEKFLCKCDIRTLDIAPTFTVPEIENQLEKTRFPVVIALTDIRFIFDGYSTDIRENSRFSPHSVQTNNDLTVVQPDLGTGSTCSRQVITFIRIGWVPAELFDTKLGHSVLRFPSSFSSRGIVFSSGNVFLSSQVHYISTTHTSSEVIR